jgi:hypothetical protein
MAGGFLIAVGVIGGAFVGAWQGQPTIGLLTGMAIGAVLAGLIWVIDRR